MTFPATGTSMTGKVDALGSAAEGDYRVRTSIRDDQQLTPVRIRLDRMPQGATPGAQADVTVEVGLRTVLSGRLTDRTKGEGRGGQATHSPAPSPIPLRPSLFPAMELRPDNSRRPRLPLAQALRYALVPTLIWGGLFLLILSALPGWAWRAKVQVRREEGLLMIGLIGMWRYGWYLLQVVRGFFYSRFVYPSLRYSAFIQRAPFPERCYFLLPSYFEDPGVTVRTFRALAREASLLPQVQVTVVAALGSNDEEQLVRRVLGETPGGERIRLVCTRQSEGKRKAMADVLRVIAQLRARDTQYIADRERTYHDAVVFMDGDTEMAEGTLAQCLPFLKAYPKVGAVTTDEIGRIYGAGNAVRAWFALKFVKRHSVMKSLSLSRKVLTLTGRFSVFRADSVLTEEMAQYLEHDGIRDWRYGRIKFLMGDDKSTWFCLHQERLGHALPARRARLLARNAAPTRSSSSPAASCCAGTATRSAPTRGRSSSGRARWAGLRGGPSSTSASRCGRR